MTSSCLAPHSTEPSMCTERWHPGSAVQCCPQSVPGPGSARQVSGRPCACAGTAGQGTEKSAAEPPRDISSGLSVKASKGSAGRRPARAQPEEEWAKSLQSHALHLPSWRRGRSGEEEQRAQEARCQGAGPGGRASSAEGRRLGWHWALPPHRPETGPPPH